MTDKEDKDDEDLRIPVQPNNSLLFVYQSEWQKRLLERFLFFFFIRAFFNSKLKKAVIMSKYNSYFHSICYYTQKDALNLVLFGRWLFGFLYFMKMIFSPRYFNELTS